VDAKLLFVQARYPTQLALIKNGQNRAQKCLQKFNMQ